MAENVGKRLEQKESKQKKAKKPSRLTKGQKWLLAVAIVLAVVLVAVVALDGLFVKPDLPGKKRLQRRRHPGGGRHRLRRRRPAPCQRGAEEPGLLHGTDPGPGHRRRRQHGHYAAGQLRCDQPKGHRHVHSRGIPWSTSPWDIKRINSVYNYYGGGEKGIKALYKEISQLVGFEPDYQVIVEWEAVGKIVDAMGGVYFDVPRRHEL